MDEKLLQELYGKVEHQNFLNKCYCKVKEACHPVKVGVGIGSGLGGYILGYMGSFETDAANLAFREIPNLPYYIFNIQDYLLNAQPDFSYFSSVSKHADEVGRRTAAIFSTFGYLAAGKVMKSFSNWWNSKFGRGDNHG